MTCTLDSHVLTGYSNGTGAENVFKHWDEDGNYIEDVAIPFATLGSGSDLFPVCFRQYGSSVYVAVTDFNNDYDAVLEYDSSLTYVREVCVMNRSDPDQNPDPGDFLGDFAVNSAGTLYLVDDDDSSDVWEYLNNGTFVIKHTTNPPSGYSSSQVSILVKPGDECEIIRATLKITTTRKTAPNRWNICTDTDITPDVEITNQSILDIGDFDCQGNYYTTVQNRTGGLPWNTTLYIYDSAWAFVSNSTIANPSGYSTITEPRVTEDGLYVWMFGYKTSDGSYAIFKVRLSDQVVVAGPITITDINAADISHLVYSCNPCFRRYQGLERVDQSLTILEGKYEDF